VKEIPPAAPYDILKVLESDFKDVSHSNVSMSQDDVQFIQLLESSITTNTKGHIEMSLPFKVRPQLPNNKKLAASRLAYLKRRLIDKPNYK